MLFRSRAPVVRRALEIAVALGLLANVYSVGIEWFIAWYSGVEYENVSPADWVWGSIGVGSSLAGALLLLWPRRRLTPH